ncbi:hypothetical protein ACBR40_20780 [Nonomuraea sp. AD125B]|uniref:hypothetical protein n=1 Tax=Nonomuraea sp. AD125B TaxID=3242897 RepID=UPI003526D196
MTHELTLPHLIDAARAWARGSFALEAAVELLIHHGVWLQRREFHRYAMDYITTTYNRVPFVIIDWQSAHHALSQGRMPCSRSEAAVLRIALSIADALPIELGPAITGLDSTNFARVLAAMNHAHGDRTAWTSARGDTTS